MAKIVVVGMQWGDEGKGKIVDLLGPAFDVVCRFQGGHNAGHTVKFEDRHFSLHLIPYPPPRRGSNGDPGPSSRRSRLSARWTSTWRVASSSRTGPT